MKVFLLTFLLSYSCTRYAELDPTAMDTTIKKVEMDLAHLREEKWLVGKRKEAELSQGLTLLLELPKLRSDDLEFLIKEKGVDAWIIRVIQDKDQGQLDLGSLYTLFKPSHITRGKSLGPAQRVGIKINYAAAHASMRFRAFSCPAFGHNKKISRMSVQGNKTPFEISVGPPTEYREKSQLVQLSPSEFNGGHKLSGKFHFEIAPYSSKSKTIFGSFKRIPRFLEVSAEENIEVETCRGVHPERESF